MTDAISIDNSAETRFTTDDFGRAKFNRACQTAANAVWKSGDVLGLVEAGETFAPASAILYVTVTIDWLIWGRRDSTNP